MSAWCFINQNDIAALLLNLNTSLLGQVSKELTSLSSTEEKEREIEIGRKQSRMSKREKKRRREAAQEQQQRIKDEGAIQEKIQSLQITAEQWQKQYEQICWLLFEQCRRFSGQLKVDSKNCTTLKADSIRLIDKNWDLLSNHTEINQVFNTWDYSSPSNKCSYMLVCLNPFSQEFQSIKDFVQQTSHNRFNITKIERVQNILLLQQFQLKKQQIIRRYGQVKLRSLFHGTRMCNIDSICKNNFNWRLNGQSKGHRFGHGIYFTPISHYATYYSDKGGDRVMFLVLVIVTNACAGQENTEIPQSSFDTTMKPNGDVFVKYEDNEFYPQYLIHYT